MKQPTPHERLRRIALGLRLVRVGLSAEALHSLATELEWLADQIHNGEQKREPCVT